MNPEINRFMKTLAETAQVTNPEKWLLYLTKWLVGVVANALKEFGCQNHLCLGLDIK